MNLKPIIIDEKTNASATIIKDYRMFFSDQLTGNNKSTGLFCEKNNPKYLLQNNLLLDYEYDLNIDHYEYNTTTKIHRVINNHDVTFLPLALLHDTNLRFTSNYISPNADHICDIEDTSHNEFEIYAYVNINHVTFYKNTLTKTNKNEIQNNIVLYIRNKNLSNSLKKFQAAIDNKHVRPSKSQLTEVYNQLCYKIQLSSADKQTLNDKLNEWFENITQIKAITNTLDEWYAAADICEDILQGLQDYDYLKKLLIYLLNYNVSFSEYSKIYQTLKTSNNLNLDINELLTYNLNLQMINYLNNKTQSDLNIDASKTVNLNPNLNAEQKLIIEDKSKYILVHAGAGTGKSTTLLDRIKILNTIPNLKKNEIAVFSFTNAAVDHIADKNPNIISSTLSNFLHEIYTYNYPTHQLNIKNNYNDTLLNVLELYYNDISKNPSVSQDKKDFVSDFIAKYKKLNENNEHSFTAFTLFTQDNFDEIISLLDTLQITTLELEKIILFCGIDKLKIPDQFKDIKHILIDESQDTNIYEFMYMLKFADIFDCSLFIIGDTNQTLYEFRGANPKLLNFLNYCDIFKAFSLTINYRSKQYILDFANKCVTDISDSHNNLTSNIVIKPDKLKFKECVKILQYNFNKALKIEQLTEIINHKNASEYIDDKLKNNEAITILASTHAELNALKTILTAKYPNKKIIDISSKQQYSQTCFSKFLKEKADYLRQTISNITNIFDTMYLNLNDYIDQTAKYPDSVHKYADTFYNLNQGQIHALEATIPSTSQLEIFNIICDLMLKYELKENTKNIFIKNNQNNDLKLINEDDYDFILSTIHGVKGLEFNNVFFITKDFYNMPKDKLRVAYVALTRAKQSEFIAFYDTKVADNTFIHTCYNELYKSY